MMFWVVETRFCIGMWLYDPEQAQELYLKWATVKRYFDYEEAEEYMLKKAGEALAMSEFCPNRLYQIRDRRIYVVYFNRKRVAFIEMEKSANLVPSEEEIFYKKRRRLTYQQAVCMVMQLGARTGSNEIFVKKMPVCGRFYYR